MRHVSLFFLALLFTGTSFLVQAREARQVETVVELFTSQGCSSCPPADALMGKLVQNPDILGLSFSVTYWDYIGWPDTFGSAVNDDRQVQYRDKLGARYVYTPQMIIAGQVHFVGSNEDQLQTNLDQYKGHARSIQLKWRFTGPYIEIDLPEKAVNATVWQLDMDARKEVEIRRGENRGLSAVYHNVVRKITSLGSWDGTPKTLKLDLDALMAEGRDTCAILIQKDGFGPIIGALVIDL